MSENKPTIEKIGGGRRQLRWGILRIELEVNWFPRLQQLHDLRDAIDEEIRECERLSVE